jgi:hypothetical protein
VAPRFCIFPARVLADERVTETDLRALAAIGRFTNADGGNVFAKNATMAEVARVSDRLTKRRLRWRPAHYIQSREYVHASCRSAGSAF